MNISMRCASIVFMMFVVGEAMPTLAALPTWTKEDTERYWASVAESARKFRRRITTSPRSAAANEAKGEGMLEAFGTKYMPTAYAFYQEKRTKAKEQEALLKENFPNGRNSDATGGSLYDKITGSFAKAIAEMDRRHDELCYYYILHKIGALSGKELASIDSSKICIMLPMELEMCSYDTLASQINGTTEDTTLPTTKERTFGLKYMPLTLAIYDKYRNVLSNGEKELLSILSDANTMDAVDKNNVIFSLLIGRLFGIHKSLNSIAQIVKERYLLHAVDEVTSEELARIDARINQEKRQELEPYLSPRRYMGRFDLKRNPMDVAYKRGTIVGLEKCMVPIPGKNYAICKYEVTWALWEMVMGREFKHDFGSYCPYGRFSMIGITYTDKDLGPELPRCPVSTVSWEMCQEFLKKLNALPEVKRSGIKYRLPAKEEWQYACRAGANGKYCKLEDGTEVTKETVGTVGWIAENNNISEKCRHPCNGSTSSLNNPIGMKRPNAFGLYDMIGNVSEWCQDYYEEHCGGDIRIDENSRYMCGSSISDGADDSTYDKNESHEPSFRDSDRENRGGFRLAATITGLTAQDAHGKSAKSTAKDESEEVIRLRRAAEQGNVIAQFNLGVRYDDGEGVKQNREEAVKWYRKAAEQGNVFAQFNLGVSYYKGEGVEQDNAEASKWFRKAAEQGCDRAKKALERMNRNN